MTQHNDFKLARQNSKAVDIDSPQLHNRMVSRLQTKLTSQSNIKTLTQESGSDISLMTTAGQFILLFSANIFLSGDFEYCLKITMNNFTCIENSCLFEGNILRFRSLAADQVYQHKLLHSKIGPEPEQDL